MCHMECAVFFQNFGLKTWSLNCGSKDCHGMTRTTWERDVALRPHPPFGPMTHVAPHSSPRSCCKDGPWPQDVGVNTDAVVQLVCRTAEHSTVHT